MTIAIPNALQAIDLYKKFNNTCVLEGVSICAKSGDVIAILGTSGSGKSTLLRCINMLTIPDSGEVYVAGEKLRVTTKKMDI